MGRPVIGTAHGLVGHLVRVHRLGAVVNVHDTSAVAEAFRNYRKFIRVGVIWEFDLQEAREYGNYGNSCAPPVSGRNAFCHFGADQGDSAALHHQSTLIT